MSAVEVASEFWRLMGTNDFHSVAAVLSPDFVLEWPQSKERIRGAERFARMNIEYPAHGLWQFTIHRIVGSAAEAVSDVSVTDGVQNARVISFFTVAQGKVTRLVEFWPEPYAAPAQRSHLVERMELAHGACARCPQSRPALPGWREGTRMSRFLVSRLDHRAGGVADAILGVMRCSYRVEADLLGLSDFKPLHRTAEQIASANALFFGITVADLLAAVAEVESEAALTAHIGSLVVLPEHFRRGLATALLDHICSAFAARDITVSTATLNGPALRLYAAHGFTEDRRWATPDGISMVTLRRRHVR